MRWTSFFALYLAASACWVCLAMVLGERQSSQDRYLREAVAGLWGRQLRQSGPTASEGSGLELASTRAQVDLSLEPRRKGLCFYSTYTCRLQAEFQVKAAEKAAVLTLPLSGVDGMLSDFVVQLDGRDQPLQRADGGMQVLLPGDRALHRVNLGYRAQGCESWGYNFSNAALPTRSFELTVSTNFRDINFLDGSVSPVSRQNTDQGLKLQWNYQRLLSGSQVAIELPALANAGPRLIQVCLSAPLGLGLYLLLLGAAAMRTGTRVQAMQGAFLLTSFYSFHLLLAYLGDLMPLPAALALAALLAITIHLSYLRRITSRRFAYVYAAPLLAVYLIGLSTALLWIPQRGLILIVTLLFSLTGLMHATSEVDWEAAQRSKEVPLG